MYFRRNKVLCVMMLFACTLAASEAYADDCGPGSANPTNPTCLPGTYVYQQIEQEKAQREQNEANQKRIMEQNEAAAAAADPRNQNDPSSPYYGPRQCEEAKRNLICTALGIVCTPPNVDCAQFVHKPSARHRHHH